MTDAREKTSGVLDRTPVHVMVLVVMALVAYSNTFHVPFVFDDVSSITENPVVQNPANFFTNRSGYDDHPNRYIGYLTFALNYHFGGLNVVGYHVVNLAIHIANALLVYALALLTLRTPFFRGGNREPDSVQGFMPAGPWSQVPFFTALLFAVHPIQTQAVTYIVQRLTSLTTLFYLAALVCYARWRLARAADSPFCSRSVLPYWILSLAAAVLAMKTKEIAFTLPFIVLLYEFSFFGRPDRRQMLLLTPLLLTAAIIPLSMVTLSKPVGELISDVNSATVAQSPLSRWEYLCTQFSVIVTYLRLLVLPVNQNLDYIYPISRSLREPPAFLSLLLLLALFGLAIWLWHRGTAIRKHERDPADPESRVPSPGLYRLIAFGILWFFITLSVESSVIPITDVIFEHRVYLPSIGFFIAFTALASPLIMKLNVCKPASKRLMMTIPIVAVLLLAGTTFARNHVWRNWETLWQDVIRKSPKSARAYNNLGTYYGNQGRYAEAIGEFEKAIGLYPRYLDAHFNLGRAYVVLGRYREAANEFRATLLIDPRYSEAQEFLKQLEIVLRAEKS